MSLQDIKGLALTAKVVIQIRSESGIFSIVSVMYFIPLHSKVLPWKTLENKYKKRKLIN